MRNAKDMYITIIFNAKYNVLKPEMYVPRHTTNPSVPSRDLKNCFEVVIVALSKTPRGWGIQIF